MAYTLITSERSPFGRICRMMMHAHGIPFELRVLNFVDDRVAAAELARETPINKVPVLVEDGVKVFDSRVILSRLMRRHGLRELSLDEENLVSAIYSCMDASVILFLMGRDGLLESGGGGFFVTRNRGRIAANIDFILPWVAGLDPSRDWYYPAMSLYSYLYWAEARSLLDVSAYPALVEFMRKFGRCRGVAETSF